MRDVEPAPEFPEYVTVEEALDAVALGWNIRCNICGNWGCTWRGSARAGWGALAVCRKHDYEFEQEEKRHNEVMAQLTKVRFEQDRATADRAFSKKFDVLRKRQTPPSDLDIGD